jgi:transcriptional regulator with XRE-family HTH domain
MTTRPRDVSPARARRIELGLSLTEAARRLGISHGHLSNVEAGRRGLSPAKARAHRELLAAA